MSRRHADNWSQLGHYLVDPCTWPWSPNGHSHAHEWPTATPLCNVNRPSNSEIQLFQTLTIKIHGQGPVWSKVKVTINLQNSKVGVKVELIGHTWGLKFNRYGCFSFCGNRTIFGWDMANSIFDLENSKTRSWPSSNLMAMVGNN